MRNRAPFKTFCYSLFLLTACQMGAFGSDWGYEGEFTPENGQTFERKKPKPVSKPVEPSTVENGANDPLPIEGSFPQPKPRVELKATPLGLSQPPAPPQTEESSTVERQTRDYGANQELIGNWLSLLGLVAPIPEHGHLPKGPTYESQLTEPQKERFSASLDKLLNGKEKAEFSSIGSYWSQLEEKMQDEDQRANYRHLFRALLSMRADAKETSLDERNMLFEALGPKRIAELGPPPLTEDAIEAYTDMACFIYERAHPGRTVDADDNRELYAMIVRDKFKNAPTAKDKAAMNDFPLSWSKFRILYTDASDAEKEQLAIHFGTPEGTRGLNIRNHTLENVLSSSVWKRFVLAAKTPQTGGVSSGKTVARTAGSSKAKRHPSVAGVRPKPASN